MEDLNSSSEDVRDSDASESDERITYDDIRIHRHVRMLLEGLAEADAVQAPPEHGLQPLQMPVPAHIVRRRGHFSHPASLANLASGPRTTAAAHEVGEQEDFAWADAAEDFPGAGDAEGTTVAGGSDTRNTYVEKMDRQYRAWADRRAADRIQWIDTAMVRAARVVLLRNTMLHSLQQALEAECAASCSSMNNDARAAGTSASLPTTAITVFTATARHKVKVPFHCGRCPLLHGFWPATPTCPEQWLDVELLELYTQLSLREGVSCTVFVDIIHERQEHYAALDHMLYSTGGLVDGSGPLALGSRIDAGTFELAWLNWLRVTTDSTSLIGLDVCNATDDPLAGCPVCAQLQESEDAAPGYKACIAVDAVTKPSHYAKCGQATRHHQSSIGVHYGEADALAGSHVAASADQKTMELEAVIKAGPGGPAGVQAPPVTGAAPTTQDAGAGGEDCNTQLHCARPSAKGSAGVDVHGVVGAVCAHGVPVRGSFMDLRTNESFGYYIILFTVLLPLLRNVRDVYVDFGCRLRTTWKRFYDMWKHTPQLSSPHLGQVRILVNWMHAASHILSCQLQHSGRHTLNAARRVGEMTEQLWSLCKYPAALCRYMGLGNRRDYLDTVFAGTAERKLPRLPALLTRRIKANEDNLKRYVREYERVKAEAAAAGVTDVEAAVEAFRKHTVPVQDPSDAEGVRRKKEIEYVRAIWASQGKQALEAQIVALAGVSASMVATLYARANTKGADQATLERTKRRLAMELKLPVGSHWAVGHPDYDRVVQDIVTAELLSANTSIQQLIIGIKEAQQKQSTSGMAGKVSKQLGSLIRGNRSKIDELVNEMNVWATVANKRWTPVYSKADVDDMVASGVVNSVYALPGCAELGRELYHGRLLCLAGADVARCEEEKAVLQQEVLRLRAWLQVVQSACEQARAGVMTPSCVEAKQAVKEACHVWHADGPAISMEERAANLTSWHLTACTSEPARGWGRWFLLGKHLRALQSMEKDAPAVRTGV